jgi:hypothetical protein
VGGDNVYVNGRSALHKGSGGKAMAAFPDLCKCPPTPPAGPIPTPLPNNAMASDLKDGAKSVLVDGNPIGTSKSHLGTSTGNEVSKPTGGAVVNGATKGKAYPASQSMDVKAEGNPIVRHLDMHTHNHSSPPSTPPWPTVAKMAPAVVGACSNDPEDPCKLVPYKDGCPPDKNGNPRTGHHVIPQASFVKSGMRGLNGAVATYKGKPVTEAMKNATCIPGCTKYRQNDAPCVCVRGTDKKDSENGKLLDHGRIHRRMDLAEGKAHDAGGWDYNACSTAAAKSVSEALKDGEGADAKPLCSEECIKAQLDDYHVEKCKIKPTQKVRTHKMSEKRMSKVEKEIANENGVSSPMADI